MPVPARRSAATCEAAPSRWDRNGPMARRHQTTSPAGLRGLGSCGQGRRTGGGRPWPPGSHADCCRGRTDTRRRALGARGPAREAPAHAWETLGWQALCRGLRAPALITHARERAHRGAGWP